MFIFHIVTKMQLSSSLIRKSCTGTGYSHVILVLPSLKWWIMNDTTHSISIWKLKITNMVPIQKISCIIYFRKLKTRETMYIQCNIKAHSSNHCCCGKAISIKYSECVSVYLPYLCGMQRACAVLYCHLWSVWSTLSLKQHNFLEKSYWTQNVCFDFFYNFCQKHFSL